jgi:hypothetical protein
MGNSVLKGTVASSFGVIPVKPAAPIMRLGVPSNLKIETQFPEKYWKQTT